MSVEELIASKIAERGITATLSSNGQADPYADIPHPAETEAGEGDDAGLALDDSWDPVDMGPVLAGTSVQPNPTVLRRNDERYLFYRGSINGIHGDSGSGKSWLVLYAITQEIRQGHGVIYLDLEDTAESIAARLINMGATPAHIIDHLTYIRPQVPFGTTSVAHLTALGAALNVSLVIIDSLGEAFALAGVNEDRDNEVGPWYRLVPRPIAESGPAIVLVDHSTKAADNPLYASGSKRKRAGITGASYLAEAVKAFVKGEGGRMRLTCAKDRHGNYRKGEIVANLVMSKSVTDTVRLELHEPDTSDRVTDLGALLAARSAVEAAKKEGRPMSKTALRGMMKIKASTDIKKAGIDLALSRGALREDRGERNSRPVSYVRDLPEMGTP